MKTTKPIFGICKHERSCKSSKPILVRTLLLPARPNLIGYLDIVVAVAVRFFFSAPCLCAENCCPDPPQSEHDCHWLHRFRPRNKNLGGSPASERKLIPMASTILYCPYQVFIPLDVLLYVHKALLVVIASKP